MGRSESQLERNYSDAESRSRQRMCAWDSRIPRLSVGPGDYDSDSDGLAERVRLGIASFEVQSARAL